jgi:hypothetical protein
VIVFVLLPVKILDGDGSPLPDRLKNDSRFDECIGLKLSVEPKRLRIASVSSVFVSESISALLTAYIRPLSS